MNEREKIFYFIGSINDYTREETVEALKNYSKLSSDEINKIIDEILDLNKSLENKWEVFFDSVLIYSIIRRSFPRKELYNRIN